ncbi:hypothetical protein Fmac_029375 [Flemingia macrophylla]|uniref:CCHC-type domain-containing protein n=1 Tax=Flemingia macrophylla TaxID=520843 RepID=A0ABD1LAC1_9FABA
MSFSPSSSKSRSPQIPADCHPNLLKRMQQDTCFICKQVGHWSWHCPSKSPTKPKPKPKPDPVPSSSYSSETIQCRCGHGSCEVKTSRAGRNFYACPIKRGIKCKDFVKWCNDPIDERDLQPPPFKYPECVCGAGVCRRVKVTESHDDAFKYYFTCPFKQGHGSCGYRVSEDELLSNNSKNTVPIQQSRQRTLQDFFEGCQNDKVDDELGKEDGLQVLIKRVRITDCSESPEISSDKEDAGEAPNATNLKRVGDDGVEFTNSVSWEKVVAEAFLLLSCLSATSRIRWRQIMFQRRIFSGVSFGSCSMGWLGRLLFFYPTQSLKFPTPQPFFCCIFPSYDPIVTEVSGNVISPSKSEDERKSIVSTAQRHREVVLYTKQRLLIDLETMDPCQHESMREAAETTFFILNNLGLDYKQFSDHVLDYINFVSSIAEIDKSMENSFKTMDEHNKLFEEEKMKFALLRDAHVKTEAMLEESNRQRQLLCGQVSNLKAMLNEIQKQLEFCELETLKIETRLGDLKRNIFETDITLKKRAEQTKVTRKLSEERQAKQIAAKEVLEKAKLELEN